MNIYAFKRHLSLPVVSRLIICYWFPYRTSYISILILRLYRSQCGSPEPFCYFFFFSPSFLPLPALLSLCRCVGNMDFFLKNSVTGSLVWGKGSHYWSHVFPQSAFIFSLTDWIRDWVRVLECTVLEMSKKNRKVRYKKGHILTKMFENQSQQSAKSDFQQFSDWSFEEFFSRFCVWCHHWFNLTEVIGDLPPPLVKTFDQFFWTVRPLREESRPLSPLPIFYQWNE